MFLNFIRLIRRLLLDGFNLLSRRRYRPTLIPFHGLTGLGQGRWQAEDDDPQFLVRGPFALGFVSVSLLASSDQPASSGFYLDNGQGFNQNTWFELGVLKQEPQRFERYLPCKLATRGIRFDPVNLDTRFTIHELSFRRVTVIEMALHFLRRRLALTGMHPQEVWFDLQKVLAIWRSGGLKAVRRAIASRLLPQPNLYQHWLKQHTLTPQQLEEQRTRAAALSYRPLLSVIMPTYNTDPACLRAALDSVLAQTYSEWELCIADDASTQPHVRSILEEYRQRRNLAATAGAPDPGSRLKLVYRSQNGHISAASNSALELAGGEFVVTLDHDDLLTPNAFYEVALLLNAHPDADMIYSDEDKLSETGERFIPYFKPDWSPDFFLTQMYTAHLAVYRRSLVQESGAYRLGFEGAQDYDLVLRLTEKTTKIYHIPTVLYSWRRTETSTARHASAKGYAYQAAQRALEEALQRRGAQGRVEAAPGYPGQFRVQYALQGRPLVSIVILTRDRADLLQTCLASIFERTTYPNFEVVVVDNGSVEDETLSLFQEWQAREPQRFTCLRRDEPFNFHTLNNTGARQARGEILLFLNNDIEVISPDWLEKMAAQAQRPQVGAVGALLLFPDHTIQHAGIVLGIGGWAGHSHKYQPVSTPGYEGRLLGPSNYSAVTGACLMIRSELFWQLGGMDEALQIACGDVELCLRARSAGYYNLVLPDVHLFHYESASRGYEDTPEKRARFMAEAESVIRRWPEWFANDPFYNPNLSPASEDFALRLE